MTRHASVTVDRVVELAQRSMFGTDNPGLCVKCGEEAMGVEPDAEKFECEGCGENGVYGAEQLLLHLVA